MVHPAKYSYDEITVFGLRSEVVLEEHGFLPLCIIALLFQSKMDFNVSVFDSGIKI